MAPTDQVPDSRSCIVRASNPEDVAVISEIYAYYVANSVATFEIDPPDLSEMAQRRSRAVGLGLPHLVAEVEGTLVGYGYASPYRTRAAYRFSVEDSIYVHPSYAGRGVGSALLGAVLAECSRGPWRQMIAVIADPGSTASVALHRKHSFRPVGTLVAVGYKFGRWIDTMLMQCALGSRGESSS